MPSVATIDGKKLPVYATYDLMVEVVDSTGHIKATKQRFYGVNNIGIEAVLGYPWLREHRYSCMDWELRHFFYLDTTSKDVEELSYEEIMEYGAKVLAMRMTGIEGTYLAPEPDGALDDESLDEEIEKILEKLTIDKKYKPELKVWMTALEGTKMVPEAFLRTHTHLFDEKNASGLPTFDLVHHEINTTADPPSLPLYPLNEVQLAVL